MIEHGSRGDGAQQGFQFGEDHLDWIEVRAVERQIKQARADGLDDLLHPMNLVRWQVVHYHGVALAQGWRG